MKKLKILGIRNKENKCWEIYCPRCNNSITKLSIAIDGKCNICGWEWKGIDKSINKKSRIALILEY